MAKAARTRAEIRIDRRTTCRMGRMAVLLVAPRSLLYSTPNSDKSSYDRHYAKVPSPPKNHVEVQGWRETRFTQRMFVYS